MSLLKLLYIEREKEREKLITRQSKWKERFNIYIYILKLMVLKLFKGFIVLFSIIFSK